MINNKLVISNAVKQIEKLNNRCNHCMNNVEKIAAILSPTTDLSIRLIVNRRTIAEETVQAIEHDLLAAYKHINREYFTNVTKGMNITIDSIAHTKNDLLSNNLGEHMIESYLIEYFINKRMIEYISLDLARFILRTIELPSDLKLLVTTSSPIMAFRVGNFLRDVLTSNDKAAAVECFSDIFKTSVEIRLLKNLISISQVMTKREDTEVVLNTLNTLEVKDETNGKN